MRPLLAVAVTAVLAIGLPAAGVAPSWAGLTAVAAGAAVVGWARRARSGGSAPLLRAVLDAQPFASLLFTDRGTIVFTNSTARALFFEGRPVEGQNFLGMLGSAPAPLREALAARGDGVFTVDTPGGAESFLLSRRALTLDGEPHVLLIINDLTRAFSRQEVTVWKKAIRLMSHEVNNSLAPITSLMHSARMLSRGSELEPKLQRVFDTVEERARHLTSFLDGYASFARLPTPQPRAVEWKRFLGSFARLYPQLRLGPVPEGAGWFDEAQLSQVLINLVKNAQEAGGPPEAIELEVTPLDGGWKVAVLDRGRGVSAEVAQHALLPFYTTKERGSGLGLALCRDVVEAHQGSIRLEPRDGGGAAAVLWLPPETKRDALTESRARLTITRA